MGRWTRLTSRRTQSRWWVPKTPQNPLPNWLNSWKRGDSSCKHEARQYPTPWWYLNRSPFRTDGGVQWQHPRLKTTIRRPQDVGKINVFFHQAHREHKRAVTTALEGMYNATVKSIYGAPPSPSRIASWGNRRHPKNLTGNASSDIHYVRNGTSQCSPYQMELRDMGIIDTDDCDHECHAGAIVDTRPCKNE